MSKSVTMTRITPLRQRLAVGTKRIGSVYAYGHAYVVDIRWHAPDIYAEGWFTDRGTAEAAAMDAAALVVSGSLPPGIYPITADGIDRAHCI